MDRAWKNASDCGPGLWKVGFWLSQGLLSTLLAGKPFPARPWPGED